MSKIFPDIQAPTNIDIEITTACNVKCRHCYNFWRNDEDASSSSIMTVQQADNIIDQIRDNGIFHVVLTGGECLTNYDVLRHFMKRLGKTNISFSMNSNLILATDDRMKELYDLGLPHTLSTLNSFDPKTNDLMVSKEGAHGKIVKGIQAAVKAGIRVSINMITTQLNKDHVFQTGQLLADLGVTNMFTTRMVPCAAANELLGKELTLLPKEEKTILNEAIRLRDATGLNIGSLIQYPICFLGDVVKYKDYVGRGCPAGKKMLCIHADGSVEACLHEDRGYGNVYTDGLKQCWENLHMWRDDTLMPKDCLACNWLEWCEGGCRLYTNDSGLDVLAAPKANLPAPSVLSEDYLLLSQDKIIVVPQRLRWRQEKGFTLVNVRGASVYEMTDSIAMFLQEKQRKMQTFTLAEFPGTAKELAKLLELWIVETDDQKTSEPVSTRISGKNNF